MTNDLTRINEALAREAGESAERIALHAPLRAQGFDPYETRVMKKRVGGGRWTTNSTGGPAARDTGGEHTQKQFGAGKKYPTLRPAKIRITQDPKVGDVLKGPKIVTKIETTDKGVKIMHLRDVKTGKTSKRFVSQGVQVIGRGNA